MTKTIPDEFLKKTDIYRDTPVRYLGYANEVGESFRSIIGSKWVMVSYGVATLYVLADTASKTVEIYNDSRVTHNKLVKTTYVATDTLIWQMLASVVIPGFTINRTCALANYLLKKSKALPGTARKWTVTGIGLVTIPFIIRPIDMLVDETMDVTLRKWQP